MDMLIATGNMGEYFKQALSDALKHSRSEVSEDVQAYLVYLLTDFARSDKVYAGVDRGEEPVLVLLLERALEAGPQEANRIFKQIGDSTLYLLGFFGEKTRAAGVSNNYYFTMGGDAYSRLASNTKQPVYHELSNEFEQLVFLLRQVSLANKGPSPEQIMLWVQEYQESGNPQLKALLMQNGVHPHLLVC